MLYHAVSSSPPSMSNYAKKLTMELGKIFQAGKGVIFALVAAIGFSAFPNLARLASNQGVPDLQVVLVDELANACVFLPLLFISRAPVRGQTHKQTFGLISTGILRVSSTTMAVLSYLYIPPAATIAISSGSRPLFAAILSRLALKERTGWRNVLGMVVQVAGVGLVAGGTHLRTSGAYNLTQYVNTTANITTTTNIQDNITRDYIVGIVLSLASTLGLVTTNVMSRSFLQKIPQLTVLAYIESLGFILVFPAMYIFNTPKWNLDISVVGILVAQGMIYTVSIACLYRSLALEKATTVAILRGLSVALAYAFQYLMLDFIALSMEYVGASIIIVSIVLVTGLNWYKAYNNSRDQVENEKACDDDQPIASLLSTGSNITVETKVVRITTV